MRHKSQQEKASLTTLDLPIPPLLEIPPLSLRTTKSDFYIWSQNLGSCPVGFFFFFFKQFSKVLKGKSEFLWILLVPAFRIFKSTNRSAERLFQHYCIVSCRRRKITISNGNYIQKLLEFCVMQASKRNVNHTTEVYVVSFSLFLIL